MNTQDTTSNYDQIVDLQIRLGEVSSIARLADEQFGDDADISGPFSIIERELDQVRKGLDRVIRKEERGESNRPKLADAINAVVSMSEDETDGIIDAVLGVLNRTQNNDGSPQGEEPEAPDDYSIPQILGKCRDEWTDHAHMAAQKHEKHLLKAEGSVSEAKGLAVTLRYAVLNDRYDTIFAPEILQRIIDGLDKAQSQIDKHGMEHTNLFLAYFDPKRRPVADDRHRVRLVSFGENKVAVIKVIKDNVTACEAPEGIGLAEAKRLVESAPCIVAEYASESDAEDLAGKLEAAGATCDVLQGGSA